MRENKYIYEEIIREKLGREFKQKEEFIKENYCVNCGKRKTKNCRLSYNGEICLNYVRK